MNFSPPLVERRKHLFKEVKHMSTGIIFFAFLGLMGFAAYGLIKVGDLVLTIIEKVKSE